MSAGTSLQMLDAPLRDMPAVPRNARLDAPVETVATWRELENCLHCKTRTWPMGRTATGKRREQCLNCGQGYIVLVEQPDEEEDDDD